jgi:hypothetical protein
MQLEKEKLKIFIFFANTRKFKASYFMLITYMLLKYRHVVYSFTFIENILASYLLFTICVYFRAFVEDIIF